MHKKKISVGIICFNEEPNILPAYNELTTTLNKNNHYVYEFIFVDNGSTDKTRDEIRKIVRLDKRVSGIFLSRNFGPESSTQASIDHATGDAYICYEGDMQDPPEIILDFIREWEKGFMVVVGVRDKLEDSTFMTIVRRAYYKIFRAISNIEIPINAGSFALLDKKAVEELKLMPEKYRFFRGLRAWVGFKTTYVNYHRRKRQRGKSSYNFLAYMHHAERSFFGFSYLPLDIIVILGLTLVFLSFTSIIIYLILSSIFGGRISGITMIILLVVFFGGIQLLALSIIGKYIQVIVEETKARPVYIVEEVLQNKQAKI